MGMAPFFFPALPLQKIRLYLLAQKGHKVAMVSCKTDPRLKPSLFLAGKLPNYWGRTASIALFQNKCLCFNV